MATSVSRATRSHAARSAASMPASRSSVALRKSTENFTSPGTTLREFGPTCMKPTVPRPSGANSSAIRFTSPTSRDAASSASLRSAIGVGPACASMPVTTHVVPALPERAGDDADRAAAVLEHRALLDVRLEVRADRCAERLRRRRSRCAAARRRPSLPSRSVAGQHVLERMDAGEHARAHHHRREARALLVGPDRDLDRRLGLDAVVVERAHDLEAGEHAVVAVELAARGLGVDVAAGDHRRTVGVAAGAPPEDVADRIDRSPRARPRAHQATTRSRPWRSRSVSARRHTPPLGVAPICREVHQRAPEAVAVDAHAGDRARFARRGVVHGRVARIDARIPSTIRASSCSVEMNGGPTAIVSPVNRRSCPSRSAASNTFSARTPG